MQYTLLSFLAGVSAKLYDDLRDNKMLKSYRNRDILEILKLFHIGAFITLSFEYPLYFYIIYTVVLFNIIGDPSCYKHVYERSIVITLLLFIPFLDHSKIIFPPIKTLISLCIILIITCFGAYTESTYIKEEFSLRKLLIRIGGFFWTLFIYYYYKGSSNFMEIIQLYVLGYLLLSVMMQTYSVLKGYKL
jgi:hypothetical protein